MRYTLYQFHPKIVGIAVDNLYHLGSIFLRAQEFYESTGPQFKGKRFLILQYMDWYSTNISTEQSFTYHSDNVGYNVPLDVIDQCYKVNDERTQYDQFMLYLRALIKQHCSDAQYLIGFTPDDIRCVNHEIAHGLFFADPTYNQQMTQLVDQLPCKKRFLSRLGEMYSGDVLVDEAQAYLATGLIRGLMAYDRYSDPFVKVFEQYMYKHNQPIEILDSAYNFYQIAA